MTDDSRFLTSVFDTIAASPYVEVVERELGDPVPVDDYSYQLAFKRCGKPFERLVELYHAVPSATLEWRCDLDAHPAIKKFHPDDTTLAGSIEVFTLDQFLDLDARLTTWASEALEADERKALRTFRFFEVNDDHTRVGFFKKRGRIRDDEMFFITQDSDGFMPAKLSFDQYVKLWDTYKGFQGWQHAHFFRATTPFKRMQHYVAQLFPSNAIVTSRSSHGTQPGSKSRPARRKSTST